MKKACNLLLLVLVAVTCAAMPAVGVGALGSSQNPQSGSVGLEGSVPGNPPTQAATIGVPSNGQVFTSIPITVSGLCKSDLLVKVFSNNVFVGSVMCVNGSYSLKIDLFSGRNDLVARVYDALDQAGPDSNVVTVTFNDAQFAKFGTHVTVTSAYARLGVNPGSVLTWPLIVSGGRSPYALSVDWGDGNGADLKSIAFSGVVNVNHTYTQAGVYNIVVKVTDANGTSAYLQLVGVANGQIVGGLSTANGGTTTITRYIILWQFMLIAVPLILVAFWLGRRHELYEIRKSIEASREQI